LIEESKQLSKRIKSFRAKERTTLGAGRSFKDFGLESCGWISCEMDACRSLSLLKDLARAG